MKYFEMENKANVLFGEYNGVTLPKRYTNEHEAYFSDRKSVV